MVGCLGVMKFNDCFELEKNSIPCWNSYYKKIFEVKKITDVRNNNDGYDIEITTKNNNIFKIDEKTRNINYFTLFQNDNKILIETCGNLELDKKGSSIFTSIADYWAYGWFNGEEIINPIIFRRKPISIYIKKNKHLLVHKISNTDELYHTENVLVDYNIIEKYKINEKENRLVFWL